MPPPTVYTEAALADFQVTALGELATALGWTSLTPVVVEAVDDALLAYGVADIATVANIPRLRALARVAIWQAVARATAGYFNLAVENLSFDKAQVHDHALAMIAEAEREAGWVGAGPSLVVTSISRPHDPYTWVPIEQRTLG